MKYSYTEKKYGNIHKQKTWNRDRSFNALIKLLNQQKESWQLQNFMLL